VQPRKRRGPKPTGKGVNVGVRLQPEMLARLDAWIAKQPRKVSRPEAIRAFIAGGLVAMDDAVLIDVGPDADDAGC